MFKNEYNMGFAFCCIAIDPTDMLLSQGLFPLHPGYAAWQNLLSPR